MGLIYFIVICIIIFAGILSAVIIYSMISLVLEERNRELSTLKILGYTKKEVIAYIYREEAILCSLGLLFGLALGQGLLYLIIHVMKENIVDMGSPFNYLIYILTIIIAVIFVILLGLLMTKKINKINILDSLKIID